MSSLNINKSNYALVVDDEVISLTISAKMVEAQGWSVETATNGQEALAKWQAKRHPLIITDCHMSNMNGFQLAKAIRNIEHAENAVQSHIIALTANADEQESNRCIQAGMNAFLTKPVNLTKLKTLLSDDSKPMASGQIQTIPFNSVREPDSSQPPVDYSILEQIFPDGAKQIKILQDLQTHVHDIYHDLQHQIEQANIEGVESAAHRMKGSCKMVGVNSIAYICAEIEDDAKSGRFALDSAISALNKSIRQFDSHLFQQLNQTNHNTAHFKAD